MSQSVIATSCLLTGETQDGRTMTTMDPNRRRQGGRGRRLDGGRLAQLPWTEVRNPYPPMELLSADQLEAIHLTSLRILEELGMEVMSSRAVAVLEAGGAEVDSGARTVPPDPRLVESALPSVPRSFLLPPPHPRQRPLMGGNPLQF